MCTQQFWQRSFFLIAVLAISGLCCPSFSQTQSAEEIGGSVAGIRTSDVLSIGHQIQAHLDAGEFALASGMIETLPQPAADDWLGRLSHSQRAAGSIAPAFTTVSQITDDRVRSAVLSTLREYATANSNPGLANPAASNPASGKFGGVTEQDFGPLINLLTSTIASESWQANGAGEGTIQAYPSGVFVDSSGTMKKLQRNAQALMPLSRSSVFADSGNRHAQWPAGMRKISLTRLEKAAQIAAAQGEPIDETMSNLAGITKIDYLVMYPDDGEIIIAGPAGPWKYDVLGRAVSEATGQPVLQLDDLVVCLRNAYQNGGKFGCAITPRQQNLAETQHFLATSQKQGKAWSKELRQTLGQQDIEVFGLDPETHAARVIVEADYHMKLIGMGLEPSIPEVPSYLDRIELNVDGSVPPLGVVRWWFTLSDEEILCDDTQQTYKLTGTGVRVLSEDELLNNRGQRIHTGNSSGANAAFANDFTRHFSKIADRYPIYREMKNLFDMALVANLIRQQQLDRQANWHLTFFGPTSPQQFSYQVQTAPAPTCVDSVMNERVLKVRQKHSTLKHTLVGVSGGVQFDAPTAITAEHLKAVDEAHFDSSLEKSRPNAEQTNWWWD